MKKFILSILCSFVFAFSAFAAETKYSDSTLDVTFVYSENSFPGEAFFVRMKVTAKENAKIKSVSATAELKDEKTISQSDFYYIKNKKDLKERELLTGLGMWSWEKPHENAIITVTGKINDKEFSIDLPVTVSPKEYEHEKIALNSDLTDLVSKPDPEKKEQSRVLNETLAAVNATAVYELNPFIRPTTGKRITSEFGQTRTFIYNNGKESPSYHAGLDFGIPTGTEVKACGKGKVVMARWRIVTGYSVIIEHLPGLYSIYYHLSELKCKEGDIVKQGDIVALSGSTGLATGPHLHWEIRLNTVCLEPDSFIKNFSFENE